jgi:hypothetical protein
MNESCDFTDQAKLKAWLQSYTLFILNTRYPRHYCTVPLAVLIGEEKMKNLTYVKRVSPINL